MSPSKRKLIKLEAPSPLKGCDDDTPEEESGAGPSSSQVSVLDPSSSATYRRFQMVMCTYGGVPYPAKILEVSSKREIAELNAMRAKKPKQQGQGGDVVEELTGLTIKKEPVDETDPQSPLEEEDEIMYYVHYTGWKTKWDEWVSSERLSVIGNGAEEGQDLKKVTKRGKRMTPVPVVVIKQELDDNDGSSANINEQVLKKKVKIELDADAASSVAPSLALDPETAENAVEQGEDDGGTGHLMIKSEIVAAESECIADEKRNDTLLIIDQDPDLATASSSTRSFGSSSSSCQNYTYVAVSRSVEPSDTSVLGNYAIEETPIQEDPVDYELSAKLKDVLVEDCSKIKTGNMVVNVQSNTGISAEDLLTEYAVCIQNTGNDEDLAKAELFIEGLRILVDTHFRNQLLYEEEYSTMDLALKDADQLTSKISAIYILRLLTRIDVVLKQFFNYPGIQFTQNPNNCRAILLEQRKFIEFVDSRSSFYFPTSMYIPKLLDQEGSLAESVKEAESVTEAESVKEADA